GKLTDYASVYNFGKDCDVITIEIEHVNTEALGQLEKEGKKVFPQPHIIQMIQDKRKQKQFYLDNDIPTAEFVLTDSKADVQSHVDFLPAVNKLGTEGYDGRGVQVIRDESAMELAFEAPSLLEKLRSEERRVGKECRSRW